jgi:hypothetical protein
MKTWSIWDISLPFFPSSLVWGSRPYRFTPGESVSSTLWIRGCVGHRAGLDVVEKRIQPKKSSPQPVATPTDTVSSMTKVLTDKIRNTINVIVAGVYYNEDIHLYYCLIKTSVYVRGIVKRTSVHDCIPHPRVVPTALWWWHLWFIQLKEIAESSFTWCNQ